MIVDEWFGKIAAESHLSGADAEQLGSAGFVIIPGPVAPERMSSFAGAYDAAMSSGDALDLKVGSSTTRRYDFVNRDAEFDDVYIYPPLLDACRQIIRAPFKLSTTLGRILRPHSAAQSLHVDIARDSEDLPMAAFILMIDEFRPDNGAPRFVPGSHLWPGAPKDAMPDCQADFAGQVLASGPAGSLIIFNGSIWHSHTANASDQPRRSIQGYFVRREARSGIDLPSRMRPETLARISPLARYVLAL